MSNSVVLQQVEFVRMAELCCLWICRMFAAFAFVVKTEQTTVTNGTIKSGPAVAYQYASKDCS